MRDSGFGIRDSGFGVFTKSKNKLDEFSKFVDNRRSCNRTLRKPFGFSNTRNTCFAFPLARLNYEGARPCAWLRAICKSVLRQRSPCKLISFPNTLSACFALPCVRLKYEQRPLLLLAFSVVGIASHATRRSRLVRRHVTAHACTIA